MKRYDLIIAGGGLTGVAAGIAAARYGLDVLLIEKNGSLGGAMSNSLVYPFMPYWTTNKEKNEKVYLSGGIFREMLKVQKEMFSNSDDRKFSPEQFKLLLDSMLENAGADVLFHAKIYDVEKSYRKLKSVKVLAGSEKLDFKADFFIDATGDGNLFYLAGCAFALGRESDGYCQPMTTCFRMSGVDIDLFIKDREHIQELYKEKQQNGDITNPRENILYFLGIGEGIIHFNTTRVIKLNPCDPFDVSEAEKIARKQIFELVEFLKKASDAFKNSTIISIASDIGVRESRRLIGKHVLTAEELKNCTKFEDAIALGNYDIDIHNPSGAGTSHYYFPPGAYYTIPYRSLLPKEYDNLLVAGRCISATHKAQASVRIMPICTCMGEAAGTAVALARASDSDLQCIDIEQLRKNLKNNGAIIEA
ncbi:MAG: FAD-dependent oxidoreductase [Ruminococcaceae bacterium]|nr:FAD-dependent oxidoreductase [Oscillospiraceae bacterium]